MVESRYFFAIIPSISVQQGLRGQEMGAISQKGADFLIRSRLADAEAGDVDALFELGLTYSTGRGGMAVDLIEAHKWFNLAALSGCTRGQECRAEISVEMTAREIAEAQRQARAWLSATGYQRRAA
jgi:TPR repeat protein